MIQILVYSTVPIVSFVAKNSNTGKTTFLVKLIKELTIRGYKVGVVKSDVHGFDIDVPGKDTWLFSKAGAYAVSIIGNDKFAIMHNTKERKALHNILKVYENIDIILTEGCKKEATPKIEIVREAKGKELCTSLDDLLAVVTDVKDFHLEVPIFELNDYLSVADFIEEKFLQKDTQNSKYQLTHFNESGRARMVDVSDKKETHREAIARGEVLMEKHTLEKIKLGQMSKGDVLGVAQVAGIMGVKETSRLIPMCHPLNISSVDIDFQLDEMNNKVLIECRVKITGQTGVEMEALTGVNIAALTIYDMCKAIDKNISINNIRLVRKSGGKSGLYQREGEK